MTYEVINAPIVSVTELKKNPGKVNEESRRLRTGVYVFNNNKPQTVILDPDFYQELIEAKNVYDLYLKKHLKQLHEEAMGELSEKNVTLLTTREELRASTDALWEEAMNE
jgi:PHD/YefM family antitoxin component YafN of YafNO toxin-antitoxin module